MDELYEDIKRIEHLIERCNQCKLNACITCDICWSEVQAIKELLERYKHIKRTNSDLQGEQEQLYDKLDKLEEENKKQKDIIEEFNKMFKNQLFIPTSVIQKKIEEVNNSNGYSPVNKIFIEKALNEILEEGRR